MEFAANGEMLESKLTFLFHEEAGGNLSEIMHGVDDYYMCRRKEGMLLCRPQRALDQITAFWGVVPLPRLW